MERPTSCSAWGTWVSLPEARVLPRSRYCLARARALSLERQVQRRTPPRAAPLSTADPCHRQFAAVTADYNGDGNPDIASVTFSRNSDNGGNVQLRLFARPAQWPVFLRHYADLPTRGSLPSARRNLCGFQPRRQAGSRCTAFRLSNWRRNPNLPGERRWNFRCGGNHVGDNR